MAQDNTTDHIQITSSDPSGATIGTDILANSVHIQEIKINAGGDGVDGLMSNAYPVITRPSETYDIFFPVAGSTDGTDPVIVSVSGGITVDLSITGGTLDTIRNGVSADIRGIKAGITQAVLTIGSDKVTVTGDVKLLPSTNNIGDVDVLTVSIPAGTGVTTAAITATGGTALTCGSVIVETGFRVTNYGPNTATVGPTMANNTVFLANGYKLQQFDSLFIEATGPGNLFALCSAGQSADLRIIGS